MSRHALIARRGFLIGAGLATGIVLLALLLMFSLNRYRQPPPAEPETLERMAAKNREAATAAAAVQRAESAASTNEIEGMAEAGRRGAAAANASLAEFNRMDDEPAAGNHH